MFERIQNVFFLLQYLICLPRQRETKKLTLVLSTKVQILHHIVMRFEFSQVSDVPQPHAKTVENQQAVLQAAQASEMSTQAHCPGTQSSVAEESSELLET